MPRKRYPGVSVASWSNFSSGCWATSRGSVVDPPSGSAPPARICEAMNAAGATHVGISAACSTSRLRPRRQNKSASASSRLEPPRCSPSPQESSRDDLIGSRGDLHHRRYGIAAETVAPRLGLRPEALKAEVQRGQVCCLVETGGDEHEGRTRVVDFGHRA